MAGVRRETEELIETREITIENTNPNIFERVLEVGKELREKAEIVGYDNTYDAIDLVRKKQHGGVYTYIYKVVKKVRNLGKGYTPSPYPHNHRGNIETAGKRKKYTTIFNVSDGAYQRH